jgi:hypothetical protein
MHHLTRFLLVASAVSAALFGGCATEEIPPYGDPAKVIGGVGATGSGSASSSSGSSGSSGSSSSGMCMPDAGCAVSFANDVFPILENTAKCSAAVCHGPGAAQAPVMTPGDAKATVQVLLGHPFNEGSDPYIVPCNPAASKMICNMKLDTGNDTNPFGPDCLPRMPKVKIADDGVADAPLTVMELNKIAEWISCGAPDN